MQVRKHAYILAIVAALFGACREVPVVETETPSADLTENLINANRYIAQSEEAQIVAYAQRRGWTMTTLPCGASTDRRYTAT